MSRLLVVAAALTTLISCGAQLPGAEDPDVPRGVDASPTYDPLQESVEVVSPSLQGFVNSAPADVVRSVRIVQGVARAAELILGSVVLVSESGSSQISVVAAGPVDFRPFAPEVTAEADFVWQGLRQGQVFLAHEEHRRLGIQPGERIAIQGPGGSAVTRVGGVAANGLPNFGGVLISRDLGELIGLKEANLIVVAIESGLSAQEVRDRLEARVQGVEFGYTPRASRAFLSGPEAEKLFTFSYLTNPDGTITPDPRWVAENIVNGSVPILGAVTCHRVMIPQLRSALAEISQKGLSGTINPSEYGGCYVPRFIERDPDKPLSLHAWGLAIDINSVTNPQGAPSKQDPRMVAIFESRGFRWGGRWTPPDAHHLELATLVK